MEYISEVQKLNDIATDDSLDDKMRETAIKSIGRCATKESLTVLLAIVADEKASKNIRKIALKQAEKLIG